LGFHEGGGSDFSERVSDFNRDGKVNIRDATDIQKHLANYNVADCFVGEKIFIPLV